MSPFQGLVRRSRTPSQGCALGYRIVPFQGDRCALSLIEVVASTMIVGMMAVAALNSLGAATQSSQSIGNRAVALGLADDLMAEILQAAYNDAPGATGIGPEAGEVARPGDPADDDQADNDPATEFDDIDDYDEWTEQPPLSRVLDEDGNAVPIEDRDDWRRRVIVEHVDPEDPTESLPDNDDQGAKRICVTIEYRDQVLAEQTALRTDIDE